MFRTEETYTNEQMQEVVRAILAMFGGKASVVFNELTSTGVGWIEALNAGVEWDRDVDGPVWPNQFEAEENQWNYRSHSGHTTVNLAPVYGGKEWLVTFHGDDESSFNPRFPTSFREPGEIIPLRAMTPDEEEE